MNWTVRAEMAADGTLRLTVVDGAGQGADMMPDRVQPVDLLVAGVAACFVKSCAAVLEARGEPPAAIRAEAVAVKAADKPARVGRMTIRYAIPALTDSHAGRIARDAKRICTVTNTLACEVTLADWR